MWKPANRVPLSHFPRHQNVAVVLVAVAFAFDVLLLLHSLTSNSAEWQRWAGERGERWGAESEAVSRTSFICITMINSKVCAREFLNFFRLVFVWIAAAAAAASVSFDFSFPCYLYGWIPARHENIFAKGKKQRESGISYLWTGSCLLALWLAHSCCVDQQTFFPKTSSQNRR